MQSISPKLDVWEWVPSIGRSGGILFGCDSSRFTVVSTQIHTYSLTVNFDNQFDSHRWMLTLVYGPRQHKQAFWAELNDIRN